jgi:hypothetical protein
MKRAVQDVLEFLLIENAKIAKKSVSHFENTTCLLSAAQKMAP